LHDALCFYFLVFHDRLAIGVIYRRAFVIDLRYLRRKGIYQAGRVIRLEVLNHPLRNKDDCKNRTDRDQQVIGHSNDIGPEVADGLGRMPGDSAHQSRRDANADGSGQPVVEGQGHHLREVAHGRFTAITLPVGIGSEACRSIKRQVFAYCRQLLRVER
jgi:hypothetical protein